MDAASQASSDAKTVIAQDKQTGGAEQAYQTLMKDYLAYQQTSGVSTTDVAAYWAQATTDLTNAKVLPDISVAWADEQLKQKTAVARVLDFQGNGSFQTSDLNRFAFSLQGNSDPSKMADATFAQSLVGELQYGDTKVTMADLDLRMDDPSQTLTTSSKITDALNAQAPLFANDASLLKSLDNASDPNSSKDGKISDTDITAWLNTYNNVTNDGKSPQADGAGPYTKGNFDFVTSIRANTYSGQGMGKGGFRVDQLGEAAGYRCDPNFDANGKGYPDLAEAYHGSVLVNSTWRQNSDIQPVQPIQPVTDGQDKTTTDPPANEHVTKDSNGATITTDDAGEVTSILYANSQSRSFQYTNGKLSGFTDITGHQFTSTDGGTTFKSNYVPKAGEQGDADVTNAKVDADGTFHATANNTDLTFGTDNKVVSSADPATKSIADQVNQSLIDASKAKPGDGYIKIAARLLGKPDANDTDPAVDKLYKELQKLNGDKSLNPGDAILTPEILAQVQDTDFLNYVQTLKDQAAQAKK